MKLSTALIIYDQHGLDIFRLRKRIDKALEDKLLKLYRLRYVRRQRMRFQQQRIKTAEEKDNVRVEELSWP